MANPTITVEISAVEAKKGATQVRAAVTSISKAVKALNTDLKILNKILGRVGTQIKTAPLEKINTILSKQRTIVIDLEKDRARADKEATKRDAERVASIQRQEKELLKLTEDIRKLSGTVDLHVAANTRWAKEQDLVTEALRRGILEERQAAKLTEQLKNKYQDAGKAARKFTAFQQDLTKGVQIALGPLSGVAARITAFSSLTSQAGLVIAGLITGLVGAGGFIFALKKSAEAMDQLIKTSDRLGIKAESLQKLTFVGTQAGVPVNQMERALETLSRRLGQAAQGAGEAERAFSRMGVNAADLASLPLDEAFKRISDALLTVEDQFTRNAIVSDLFSRANIRLINVLALGSKEIEKLEGRAEELGFVLREELLRNSERAINRIDELGRVIKVTAFRALAPFIPFLEHAALAMTELVAATSRIAVETLIPIGWIHDTTILIGLLEKAENRVDRLQSSLSGADEPGFFARIAVRSAQFPTVGTLIDASEVKNLERAEEELKKIRDRIDEIIQMKPEDMVPANIITEKFFEVRDAIEEVVEETANLNIQFSALKVGPEFLQDVRDFQEAMDMLPSRAADLQALGQFFNLRGISEAGESLGQTMTRLVRLQREATEEVEKSEKEMEDFKDNVLDAEKAVKELARDAENAKEQFQAISTGGIASLKFVEDIQAAREALEGFSESELKAIKLRLSMEGLVETGDTLLETVTRLITAERTRTEAVEAATEAIEDLIDSEKERIDTIKDLRKSMGEQIRDVEQETKLIGLSNSEREVQQALLKFDNEILETNNKLQEVSIDLLNEQAAARIRLERALRQQQIAQLQQDLVEEQQKSAIKAAKKRQKELQRAIEKPFKDAVREIENAFEDLFVDILDDGLKAFDTFGDDIVEVMKKTAGRIAALLIFNPQVVTAAGGVGAAIGTIVTGGTLPTVNLPGAPGGPQPIGLPKGGIGGSGGISVLGPVFNPNAPPPPGGTVGGTTTAGLSPAVTAIIGAGAIKIGADLSAKLGASGLGHTIGSTAGGVIGAVGGAALGAKFGSAGGPIGFIVGAILGALLGGLIGLATKPSKGKIQLLTSATDTANFEQGISTPGPFGFVGLEAQGTKRQEGALVQSLSEFFVTLDQTIAESLDLDEIKKVGLELQTKDALRISFTTFDNELSRIAIDRMRTILETIIDDQDIISSLLTSPNKGVDAVEEILERVDEFLKVRRTVIDILERLETGDEITQAEQAIEALAEDMKQLTIFAAGVGISLDRVVAAGVTALERIITNFDDQVQLAILKITDPLAAAVQEQADVADERLREAEALGANILEVERLNALERQAIIEQGLAQLNDGIRNFLDSILTGPQSPLAPTEVLKGAEARFEELRASLFGDDPIAAQKAREEITDAARNLIDASRAVFASSDMFFQRFNFVVSTLQNAIGDVPQFQHGGRFVVPRKAAGDNNIPLFRATGGEIVTITPPGQAGDFGGLEVAAQSIEQTAEIQRMSTEISNLANTVERQQATINRLIGLMTRKAS